MADDNKTWFTPSPGLSIVEEMSSIQDYAYRVFDDLDTNSDGYLQWRELQAAMLSPTTNDREKKFIQFLMDNQRAISASYDEGVTPPKDGMSRNDLLAYFSMIREMFTMP